MGLRDLSNMNGGYLRWNADYCAIGGWVGSESRGKIMKGGRGGGIMRGLVMMRPPAGARRETSRRNFLVVYSIYPIVGISASAAPQVSLCRVFFQPLECRLHCHKKIP